MYGSISTVVPQVPFLSVGDDVGTRVVLHEGNSEFSGDYVIEDVRGQGGGQFRRLIFLSNKNVVQSEAKIVTGKAPTPPPWGTLI